MTVRHIYRRSLLTLLLAITLAVPACGSSDSNDGANPADTTATSAANDPAGFDAAAYCDAALAIELAQPDIDFEQATPDEITAGLKAWAKDDLRPLYEDVKAVAPAELDDALATYGTVIADLVKTGDPSLFDAPELSEAFASAHAYDRKTCDWSSADVVATDFAFAGLEETYEPGPISIDLTNEGKEVHELNVVRVKDGVAESAEALIQLSQEDAFEKVDYIGTIDAIGPGTSDYLVLDLDPGRYVVSCFLPKGATDMDHLEADGMPHALSGMFAEFTVA